MNSESREVRASAAFVALTDTLVSDFDIIDLMHTLLDSCIDLLDTDAGGLLLVDGDRNLQLMASSIEEVETVEVVQLAAESGPCMECFTTGKPVTIGDIEQDAGAWPEFQQAALAGGYRSVHATPMRLRGRIIGTMNLFHSQIGALGERDIALAQALTDVATIGILQDHATKQLRDLSTQLQGALDSRIVVEQAKGLLAQSLNLTMDQAFALLRNHARSTNQPLQAVATAVTARHLVLSTAPETAARGAGAHKLSEPAPTLDRAAGSP